ncbi:hypothetical protein [Hymenobacter fodinae]|uniref:Outer membrane protein beta-barrel domain-containing protein n=1 Tax=Hymenobacter fodinae TaxID=2510796 RepID=A0A4Z0P7W5_9BACT|nr:hypothetical protein [Hymenobacter fodinae]TGE08090.1 hypothetical protein EU556_10165 [Hymenobacter fodinae]
MLRSSLVLLSLLLAGATASAQTLPYVAAGTPVSGPGLGTLSQRTSFSLNAGAMFAGRYGSASYISPTMAYQVTKRFSVFGGATFLRTTPGVAYGYAYPGTEAGYRASQPGYYGMNRMLIQGGGQYALSPRLTLTGSAWKDLTPGGYNVNPYAGFGGNMGSGVNLRADYHITENFSVSGGLRMSNGTSGSPGYSPMYSPGMPFGY